MVSENSIKNAASRAVDALGGTLPYGRRTNDALPNVISVLDDFTASCLSNDLNLFALGLHEQEAAYRRLDPVMLFSESAWNGNSGAWQHKITNSRGPRPEYVEAIAAAKRVGVPTVFWNKEDPPHFEEFIEAAALFDHVYTTEAALIPEYQRRLGHERIRLLRFAAAPHLHQPRRTDAYRSGEIAFAGQYFAHKFPERREQMEILFEPARLFKFAIYSRALGGDPNYQFPAPYSQYVVGSLPYREMTTAYRQHKVFLNVNSVPKSESMCARRIYELTSSKTAVVSVETAAIRASFGDDEVILVRTSAEAHEAYASIINDAKYRRALVQRAWRRTAREHTYRERIRQVLSDTGAALAADRDVVTLFTRTNSEAELNRVIASIGRQSAVSDNRVEVELVAVAPESSGIGRNFRADRLRVKIVRSMAEAAASSRGNYWGPWVPAVSYGRWYLEDLWLYLSKYVPEPIVGKPGTFESLSFDEAENGVEETAGTEVLSGAWLARSDIFCRELLEFGLFERAGVRQIPCGAVYKTDAFNAALTDALPRSDWEI